LASVEPEKEEVAVACAVEAGFGVKMKIEEHLDDVAVGIERRKGDVTRTRGDIQVEVVGKGDVAADGTVLGGQTPFDWVEELSEPCSFLWAVELAHDWLGDSPEEAAVAVAGEAEQPEGACCAHTLMELELAVVAVDWADRLVLECLPSEGHWEPR
jgi:hypothetical protein